MGYSENSNAPILETDINKSPKENVRLLLKNAGVDISDRSIRIYSSDQKSCECAKHGRDCYCKLGNSGIKPHSCGDVEKICKKEKFIEIKIKPEEADQLGKLGFTKIN